MKKIFLITFSLSLFISGCANQQPPSGGDEDRIPPRPNVLKPQGNTMFKGDLMVIEFDEYVDKRSFLDAFRIFPQINDVEFNWNGKIVEIVFPFSLEKVYPNKTFVINIGTALKDLRGNSLTNPFTFAFSTGIVVDMGMINGKVYNQKNKKIFVFAYKVENYNPVEKQPNYYTEVSPDGNYSLSNISPGQYRLIALEDTDRNLFYTPASENYGVLPYDLTVRDSSAINNVDFMMKDSPDKTVFFSDPGSIVYSSVENGSINVLPWQSIYFTFKKFIPKRDEFVSNFKITDESTEINLKPVFNWKNDSTVEVFPRENLDFSRRYYISFNFRINEDSIYSFKMNFITAGRNSFGEIKGKFISDFTTATKIIEMKNSENISETKWKFKTDSDEFSFSGILEGSYSLFSYIDENNDEEYDYGNPYPFQQSEPFFVYPNPVKIRGGWSVENILIKLLKPE